MPIASDRFYWLTAFLAARGLQRLTTRLVAASIICLAAMPPLLLVSPYGAHGRVSVLTVLAVAAAAFGIACLWLRKQWPKRWQSQTCVIAGALCISAAASTAQLPALGLIGCGGFVVLSAFTACFHSLRLVQLVWLIALVTLIPLAVRAAADDVALAVATAALCILTNIFVVFICWLLLGMIDHEHHEDIEPLTGLLTRAAFNDRVSTLIHARERDDDRFLAILAVSLDGFAVLAATSSVADTALARVAISQRLRETVRSNAIVANVGESDYLVADVFTTPDVAPLAERICNCVATAPHRLEASVGAVSTPLRPLYEHADDGVCEELIALASMSMHDARRAGGNQAHYAVCPPLKTLQKDD